MDKLFSICIPCYNAEPNINNLLDCLAPQITKEVEVVIVDDGSDKPFKTDYEWAEVHRQDNRGVSYTRNQCIELSKGAYLAFVDADDMVADNYVSVILNKIKTEKFNYCYLSWKCLDDESIRAQINGIDENFPIWNRSIWNRVLKRSFIGDIRFNTNKSMGEDADFIRQLNENGKKKAFISEFMYFYRRYSKMSLTDRFGKGMLKTRRVIYYFPKVSEQMTFLVEEFRQLNEKAEIILMTNVNEIPILSKYALVITPRKITGTELRGYPTNLFTKITMPIRADIVIWTEKTYEIGGIETFNYNFCKQLSRYYDIVVLYNVIDAKQRMRISEFARPIKNDSKIHVECDTLIINRITDVAPANVSFKRKVQMVHSCKWANNLKIPQDNNYLVAVSDVVAKTYADFKPDYKVIQNLTVEMKKDKALIIVSATRTGTREKGQKRMIELSNLMRKKGIPFVWYCFTENPIPNATNICFLKPTLDIAPYIRSADYLAQLSDHEGFCFSIVEAMELSVPVLVTDLPVLKELGFEEGVTGYKVPWEITDKFDVEKIYKHQLKDTFEYSHNNEKIIKQWQDVLGNGHPYVSVSQEEPMLKIKALITFDDVLANERITKGAIIERKASRAYDLMQKKFVTLELD